ncbi:MAG: 1-deoxy-D-xylulose-5-phosphate reductoisomerase [bacterium]
MPNKRITILGSTGSIGRQTLDVIAETPGKFTLNYLTANNSVELLIEQTKKHKPFGVVISDEKAYNQFKKESGFEGEILFGEEGLIEAASSKENDVLVSSLVGFAGVKPTLAAIKNNIDIALANKETLVAAGEIITKAVNESQVALLPIDSEHSAIFQCLAGEEINEVEKIILTASGGPFWKKPSSEFKNISLEDALKHPNWSMGKKITIDSATMMNKGFEVIEAFWLFGITQEQIEVLIHPQSIVHSLIQFRDSSIKAQLGVPDMRMPISYSLNFPRRLSYSFKRLDLSESSSLEFFKPDLEKFRCLKLAFDALKYGGNMPTILNAANEIAVAAFLDKRISFNEISTIIEKTMDNSNIIYPETLDEIIEIDKNARIFTQSLLK